MELPLDEEVILAVANAYSIGADTDQIREAMIKRGWQDDDIFLAIKAGQILYDARVKLEEEKKSIKPPFGRK